MTRLGESAEKPGLALPAADARSRWRACCHAVRDWALAHPHEYALIYGSPVPGYQAPAETIGPAGRVAAVIGGVLAQAWSARAAGRGHAPEPLAAPLTEPLAGQARLVAEAIAPGVPEAMIARGLIAWTQLFGMVSFELFGQLVGSADPADAFFGYAVEQMADFLGIQPSA